MRELREIAVLAKRVGGAYAEFKIKLKLKYARDAKF